MTNLPAPINKQRVGAFIKHLLHKRYATATIVAAAQQHFPARHTTNRTVAWYAWKLKRVKKPTATNKAIKPTAKPAKDTIDEASK